MGCLTRVVAEEQVYHVTSFFVSALELQSCLNKESRCRIQRILLLQLQKRLVDDRYPSRCNEGYWAPFFLHSCHRSLRVEEERKSIETGGTANSPLGWTWKLAGPRWKPKLISLNQVTAPLSSFHFLHRHIAYIHHKRPDTHNITYIQPRREWNH